MVYSENGHVIDAEELKEIIDEETTNPTVDRLMFIEGKAANGDTKIFPCFAKAWGNDADGNLRFWFCIVQSAKGNFGMVEVAIPASELGVKKRVWDKPPTKGRREYIPFADVNVETEVQ